MNEYLNDGGECMISDHCLGKSILSWEVNSQLGGKLSNLSSELNVHEPKGTKQYVMKLNIMPNLSSTVCIVAENIFKKFFSPC